MDGGSGGMDSVIGLGNYPVLHICAQQSRSETRQTCMLGLLISPAETTSSRPRSVNCKALGARGAVEEGVDLVV